MKILDLPESWRTRALVVHDVALPESWFSEEEMEIVRSFSLDKRRREWMLSRIAEKELRRRGATGDHVSFSHAGSYGAAAVGEGPLGIDVEPLRLMAPAAAHLFLSEEEEESTRRVGIKDALLHFWTAKEARWKEFGGSVPTLKRVRLELLDANERGLRFAGVETFRINDVVIALTRPIS